VDLAGTVFAPNGLNSCKIESSIMRILSRRTNVGLVLFAAKGRTGVLLRSSETNVCDGIAESLYVVVAESADEEAKVEDASVPLSVARFARESLSATDLPITVDEGAPEPPASALMRSIAAVLVPVFFSPLLSRRSEMLMLLPVFTLEPVLEFDPVFGEDVPLEAGGGLV